MSLKRTAITSAFWAVGESWALRAISAAVFLILARLVDPAAFGLVALAQVYVMTVQTLSDQGLATALQQRDAIEPEHKDSAFWANLAVGALLALGTLAIAEPLARLYGEPRLAPVLRWFGLTPFLAGFSIVQQALMRRAMRWRELAMRQVIGSFTGGAIGLAMAFGGMGVWALVGQALSTQAISNVVLWSIADWRPSFAFSWRHFRDLFGFGLNVLATNIIRVIGFQADRLIMGYFLGAADLGYYSVAQRVVGIVTDFVAGSTERIVVPLFARIQDDRDRVNRGLMTAQENLSLIVIPAFVGVAAVAPALIRLGVGPQWDPSVLPTRILAFYGLGFCLAFFFGQVLTALGRPSLRLVVVICQALSLSVLVLIGVRFGVAGVAGAVAVNQLLFYMVELAVLRGVVRFPLGAYLARALPPALAAALMAGAVLLLEQAMAGERALFRLPAAVGLGILVYGGALLVISRPRLLGLIELLRRLRG